MPEENTAPATGPTPVQGGAPGATPVAPSGSTNGLAIAALIVGIVAAVSGWAPIWGVLVGVAAIVLGALALKKATGKGMAIAGIITGAVGTLWSLIVTAFFIIALAGLGAVAQTAQDAVNDAQKEQQTLVDAKKDFEKGSTANFANTFEVKVTDVQANYNAGEYHEPATGKQFIKVVLSVKNISDKSEYLSQYDFSVLDNGIAKTSTYTSNNTDELESGDLAVGATTTGSIVYEVTAGASDLKLVYKDTIYDSKTFAPKELTYTLAF